MGQSKLSLEQRLRMLDCPKGPVSVVLDTDAFNEIDDQYAIALALRAEKLSLEALYAAPFFNNLATSPGDGMERSFGEIQKLLGLLKLSRPVFKGAAGYLPDEATPVSSPAALDLAQRAMKFSPGRPLYVVAIGAITNVASALLLQPEIADRMVVIWLGGHALHWPDNGEFNIRQDVAAARVVFNSGVPLVMLPCRGVVSEFATTEPELRHWLSGKNALCDYLVRHTVAAAEQYAAKKVWSRVLWDVTAVGWLLNDDRRFMLDRLIPTPIPEYDHHWAQDPRRPLCKYVYHIQRDALLGRLFQELSKPL